MTADPLHDLRDLKRYTRQMQAPIPEGIQLHKMEMLVGACKLVGEANEVLDLIVKHIFQGHELDSEKLIGELGDTFFNIVYLMRTLELASDGLMEVPLERIIRATVHKLNERYPEGQFSHERSRNRTV